MTFGPWQRLFLVLGPIRRHQTVNGGIDLFRIFSTKSAKKRSVLRKQRVKGEQSDKKIGGFSWSLASKGLVLVFCCFLIWGLSIRVLDKVQSCFSYLNSLIVLTPVEWNIEVIGADGSALPDDIRHEIYRIAQKLVKTGSPEELHALARQTESLGMLDSVKVIRPVTNTIILSSNLRRPSLLVEVGSQTRYLTADGTVFGDASEPSSFGGSSMPSVTVSGIFDQRTTMNVDPSMRLLVLPEERLHLADAIDIWQKAAESGIEARAIKYQRFRGFSVVMPDESEIVLGLSPFDFKLKKLRSILDGLKRDGIVASRIELDYEGKAFIKEKRL